MLGHRLRRWPGMRPPLGEHPVFTGLNTQNDSYNLRTDFKYRLSDKRSTGDKVSGGVA